MLRPAVESLAGITTDPPRPATSRVSSGRDGSDIGQTKQYTVPWIHAHAWWVAIDDNALRKMSRQIGLTHCTRRTTRMRSVGDEATKASRASRALWDLVQSSKAYRSAPRASLYNDRATREAVREAVCGGLAPEQVPRTMLSLAFLGGALVWRDEMDALVDQVRDYVAELGSLRAVDDVGRALRLCRHQGDEALLAGLDARGQELFAHATRGISDNNSGDREALYAKDMGLAASIAGNVVFAGAVPRRLLGSLATISPERDEHEVDEIPSSIPWNIPWNMACIRSTALAVVCADRVLAWESKDRARLVSALRRRIEDAPSWDNSRMDRDLQSLHPFLLAYCPPGDPLLDRATVAKRDAASWHTVSTFQKEVKDVLYDHLGMSCAMEGDVRGVSVDILIRQERVAIECNGSSHYYRNAGGMLPMTRLKTSLVEDDGLWRLINVDQREWDGLEDRAQRGVWLRNKLAP